MPPPLLRNIDYEVNTMQKPKMVIFDAGKTLLNYLDIDTLRGVRVYTKYLSENPRNLTAEDIDREVNAVFETFEACRKNLFEVHEQTVLKLAFDLLGLKFSIPVEEIERIIWENDSTIVGVKGAEALLGYLNQAGIRTAVISNLDFSGHLLEERLNRVYPNNRFEFVIASSDYGIRKPMRHLFDVGIRKSGLNAGDIWYAGDKLKVDVKGAKEAGMVPVLYRSEFNTYGEIPEGLISVGDYGELIEILHMCKNMSS